jgi:hypothetical protein
MRNGLSAQEFPIFIAGPKQKKGAAIGNALPCFSPVVAP